MANNIRLQGLVDLPIILASGQLQNNVKQVHWKGSRVVRFFHLSVPGEGCWRHRSHRGPLCWWPWGSSGAVLARFSTFPWVSKCLKINTHTHFDIYIYWVQKLLSCTERDRGGRNQSKWSKTFRPRVEIEDTIPGIRDNSSQIFSSDSCQFRFAQSALTHHATLVPNGCRSKPAQWSCHDHSHMAKVSQAVVTTKSINGFFVSQPGLLRSFWLIHDNLSLHKRSEARAVFPKRQKNAIDLSNYSETGWGNSPLAYGSWPNMSFRHHRYSQNKRNQRTRMQIT